MSIIRKIVIRTWFTVIVSTIAVVHARVVTGDVLTAQQKSLIVIAALTAEGNLPALKPALAAGLEAGLTVNQIKEIIVHLYAYAGFPRSIRGLQTFMEVLEQRESNGINDVAGAEATPLKNERSKYDRGKVILDSLLGSPQGESKAGYAAFAPEIEVFLKEHLFADIFERDVLDYTQRELVTVSTLSSIGGVGPMLNAHLKICLNLGLSPQQLSEFVAVLPSSIDKEHIQSAKMVLDDVLKQNDKNN